MPIGLIIARINACTIHNFVSSPSVLDYVLNFLNLGCKFIPDMHRSTGQDILYSLNALQRNLDIAKYFNDTVNDSHLRRFVLPNKQWQPPQDPSVTLFINLLRDDLRYKYRPTPYMPSFGWFQRKAIQ